MKEKLYETPLGTIHYWTNEIPEAVAGSETQAATSSTALVFLPGLTADTMRILTWIRDELPGIPVSLMGQYVPCGEASAIPGMNRRLTRREYDRVLAHMEAIGLDGYRQLPSAADEAFIPSFDGEGV